MQWTQNLCRICGQISETCHSIYSADVASVLEDKIKKCFNLTMCRGDYKPQQICNSCVLKLDEFSRFIDTCYSTNEKFESIYYSSQSWQDRNYDYHLPQKQSVIVSNKQAGDNLDPGIVLENLHMNNYPLNDTDVLEIVGEGNYNSENCGNAKARSPYSTVLRHPPDSEQYIPPPNNNNDICYTNLDDFHNINSSNAEPKNMDEKKNSIKKTVSVKAIQNSLEAPLNNVQIKNDAKKSYPCPHCDKTFLRRGSLNSHVANHTNIRPFKCDDCSKTFAVKSQLTAHKKIHGDIHKCQYCSKKFPVPSKLDRHVRIHKNDKPFVCNHQGCGKAFSDKRNLQGHKLTHSSVKQYSCPVCIKMFKTVSRLKQHLKCHTSAMMYTCNLCLKKYKYKSNLISHIKKHNNICPYCKKELRE
ncbi:hypothetical protein NQ315_001804 [Exocentrus adspersus]|uniref:Uncharacterized protein n=1 Tax=Exocentrus adspersus TaxID=1586481 RepID=A0AAV8W9N1_9CUCU|nr:hypothetical protein NQ315_001804 [Exocentrus adspersus]